MAIAAFFTDNSSKNYSTNAQELASSIKGQSWFSHKKKFRLVSISGDKKGNVTGNMKFYPFMTIDNNELTVIFSSDGSREAGNAKDVLGDGWPIPIDWGSGVCFGIDFYQVNYTDGHRKPLRIRASKLFGKFNKREVHMLSKWRGRGCVTDNSTIVYEVNSHIEVFNESADYLRMSGLCKSNLAYWGGCPLTDDTSLRYTYRLVSSG